MRSSPQSSLFILRNVRLRFHDFCVHILGPALLHICPTAICMVGYFFGFVSVWWIWLKRDRERNKCKRKEFENFEWMILISDKHWMALSKCGCRHLFMFFLFVIERLGFGWEPLGKGVNLFHCGFWWKRATRIWSPLFQEIFFFCKIVLLRWVTNNST